MLILKAIPLNILDGVKIKVFVRIFTHGAKAGFLDCNGIKKEVKHFLKLGLAYNSWHVANVARCKHLQKITYISI